MLNELTLKNLKPKDKAYKQTDRDGLYVYVSLKGTKIFRYDYKLNDKRNVCTIGKYPSMSLKEARIELENIKELVRKGINPNRSKKYARSPKQNFKLVTMEWFNNSKDSLNERYARSKMCVIEKNIFPHFGERNIETIKPLEILDVIRKIEERGALTVAHQTKNILGEIFGYAMATGRAEFNAVSGLNNALAKRPQSKHRATITDTQEIGELLRAIHTYEEDTLATTALKILPYTMLRPIEVISAKWEHINLKRRVWKIPASNMKAGRIHIVPLSRQVVELFKSVPIYDEYVFWSDFNQSGHINPIIFNRILRKLNYANTEITAHGFRAMASTILYENGFSSDIVEMQLAHVEKNKVRGAYNHALYLDKRAEMLQWYADYLDSLRDEK